ECWSTNLNHFEAASQGMKKQPFNIAVALRRIRKAVAPYPKAAMFALAEHGYTSVFAQLAGCMISIRTRDEVSLPTSLALLDVAATPAAMSKLKVTRIDELIRASSFHRAKAAQILAIA